MPQPEQEARIAIDKLLVAASGLVCDADKANIHGAFGVAIHEFLLPRHGFADYFYICRWQGSRCHRGQKRGCDTLRLPSVRKQTLIIDEVDRRLSLARELESQIDADLKSTECLRQSILGAAFSRTLRVDLNNIPSISRHPSCVRAR